jgi:hypothetical protein
MLKEKDLANFLYQVFRLIHSLTKYTTLPCSLQIRSMVNYAFEIITKKEQSRRTSDRKKCTKTIIALSLMLSFVLLMTSDNGFVVYAKNNSTGLDSNSVPFLFFSSPSKSMAKMQSSALSKLSSQPTVQSSSSSQLAKQSSLQTSLSDPANDESPPLSSGQLSMPSSSEHQTSSELSPWFPSVPASACKGIFQFTIDGTAHLNDQHFKNANHNITLQLTSINGNSIAGKFWIDKKGYNDNGIDFNINNISNNCKYVIFNRQ